MTLRLHNHEFAELVAWFRKQRLLQDSDIYPVDVLARGAGEDRPAVLCALAFCLRAARHGHTGLWLDERVAGMLAADLENEQDERALLDKLAGAGHESWPELLEGSPLVATAAGEPLSGGFRPFVLLGTGSRPGGGKLRRLLQLKHYLAEMAVASKLLRLIGQEPPAASGRDVAGRLAQLEAKLAVQLEEQQRRAVAAALGRRLTVLTGGPGTGKTFTLGLLLRAWLVLHDGEPPPVALAAPTGKAADRMREALGAGGDVPAGFAEFLEANRPRTLHRLLGAVPGRGFRYGAERKLPHRLVVVDETSMVDLLLMQRLLEALPDDAHLVLVGDAEQLASVEVGCVLGDIVRGLGEDRGPVIRLQRVHRTAGTSPLARLAEQVRELGGGRVTPQEVVGFLAAAGEELELVEATVLDGALLERLCRPFAGYLAACREAAAAGGAAAWQQILEALFRYRVLAPFRRGPLGIDKLNERIRQKLAEQYRQLPGAGTGGGWFDVSQQWYPGRAVMVTENRYDLGLFNGDVGAVVLADGRPQVVFPGAAGGEPRCFLPAQLPACETVFATTVHKAQGSEFDEVAVVLPPADNPLLTRELVYTAVTRARRRLAIFATAGILGSALSRPIRRASGLAELLACPTDHSPQGRH